MRKLRLEVDQLDVETFTVTDRPLHAAVTVRGHMMATYGCTEGWDGCPQPTIHQVTCWSCNPTERGFTCVYLDCAPPD